MWSPKIAGAAPFQRLWPITPLCVSHHLNHFIYIQYVHLCPSSGLSTWQKPPIGKISTPHEGPPSVTRPPSHTYLWKEILDQACTVKQTTQTKVSCISLSFEFFPATLLIWHADCGNLLFPIYQLAKGIGRELVNFNPHIADIAGAVSSASVFQFTLLTCLFFF